MDAVVKATFIGVVTRDEVEIGTVVLKCEEAKVAVEVAAFKVLSNNEVEI